MNANILCHLEIFILGFGVKQVARRRNAHLQKYPDAKVISLGIGDTTEPIPEVITSAMANVRLLFIVLSFFITAGEGSPYSVEFVLFVSHERHVFCPISNHRKYFCFSLGLAFCVILYIFKYLVLVKFTISSFSFESII